MQRSWASKLAVDPCPSDLAILELHACDAEHPGLLLDINILLEHWVHFQFLMTLPLQLAWTCEN